MEQRRTTSASVHRAENPHEPGPSPRKPCAPNPRASRQCLQWIDDHEGPNYTTSDPGVTLLARARLASMGRHGTAGLLDLWVDDDRR